MPPPWYAPSYLLSVLPAATVFLLAYALAPRPDRPGPDHPGNDRPGHHRPGRRRLAVVRAVLATGSFAVLTVELAAAAGALTPTVIRACWLGGVTLAAAAAWYRWRAHRDGRGDGSGRSVVRALADPVRAAWRTAGRFERMLAGALVGMVAGELVMALLAEPNNFDSQTYHLPRIEHWIANGDVDPYPTAIHRQVTLAPGAEYLLLHMRLLTGGDALYHLPQWAAGLVCLLVAARIAAQLGAGRRAQLITAFLVGTTPMVVMQSTSTQNDLVTAAWTVCVATLVLDGLTRRPTVPTVLGLGAALGLTAVTKNSGLLAAGPLLVLWAVAGLVTATRPPGGGWARRAAGRVAAGMGVLAIAAVLVGPFLARTNAEFGHPLGPPRLRDSIPMQRHDPAAVLVNALRIGQTALDTPFSPVRGATATLTGATADLIGVDPQDRRITFGRTTFPVPAWYPDEDRVAFPISGTLALIGVLVALVRPRRLAPCGPGWIVRGYALVLVTAVTLYAATIKWQPWGNRLLLFSLVLAVPLAGLWIDAALRRSAAPHRSARPDRSAQLDRSTRRRRFGGRPVAPVVVATVLAVATVSAGLSLAYGFPRRFVGHGSVLADDGWQTRFVRRPGWAEEFRWAAAAVDAAGAHRIGLVQQNDNWEYPWWLLLRDHEIVALQSVLPKQPPADPDGVDAVVCTGSRGACQRLLPPGWRLEFRDYVGYALPPR